MLHIDQQTRGFSLLHQTVHVTFGSNDFILDGYTELIIKPLSDTLPIIPLNARGLEILSITVNDIPTQFTLNQSHFFSCLNETPYAESLKKGGAEIRQHQLESWMALEKERGGELLIDNPLEEFKKLTTVDIMNHDPPSPSSPSSQRTHPPSFRLHFSKEPTLPPLNPPITSITLSDSSQRLGDASISSTSVSSLSSSEGVSSKNLPMPSNPPGLQPITIYIHYRVTQLNFNAIQFFKNDHHYCLRISSMPKPASALKSDFPLSGCAREWVPCVDRLHEKASWELFFDVSEFMSLDDLSLQKQPPLVLCSGKLVTQENGLYCFQSEASISAPMIAIMMGTFDVHTIPTSFSSSSSSHLSSSHAPLNSPMIQTLQAPKFIHVYAYPCFTHLIRHSSHILKALISYFSDTFGPYPYLEYEVHRIVFSPDLSSSPFPHGAGMTFIDQSWLCSTHDLEKTLEQRRILMQSIAYQWFSCWILPKTWSDYWCILGLAQFMASCFYRCHFGNNEYQYRLKKDFQRLGNLDVYMPPLSHVPQPSSEFLNLKSALIVYALDKKMSKVASSGITLCIQKILKNMTPSNMLSTNGFQRQIRSEASVDGLRTFWDQWVHGSGVPKIEFTYSQNNGRQVIEFDMVQSNTSIRGRSAGIQSGVFTGAISISVYEIDGVIYTHNLDVARTTQHFEVRFNSRYKYKKMLGKSTVGAAKEEEEEEWLNTVKDDNMFEQHRWIQWVWVDPDAEWPCPVILKQPDFKWARLVQHAPSVLCQFDAVSHLRNYPSLQCAQLLFKLASDPKVFHRIRSDAVNSMVACAIPELDWIGFEYLLQLLQRYTVPCSSELLDVVPSSSNWQNFQEFFVFKSVFSAFSLIKNEFGNSPYQVKRLILNAIKYNDATRLGSISESEYLSFLIKCLCQVMLIIPLPFQRNRNSKLKASHSMTTSNRFSEPKDLKPTETVQPVGPKVNSEELDLGFDFLSDNLSDGEKSGHKESKNEKESVESKDPSSNNSTSSPSLENVGKFKLSFSTMPLVLEEALESIERVRIMELMTSCGKDITIACLSCLCQWMMANLIDLELDLFLEYSGPSFSSEIRLAAVQCLFLLQAYENDFVTKYLFQLIQENDPSPVLQREIPHYFLAIARLSGAQDKGTLKGKRLVNFEKFKEFTLKWLPELTSILLNTHITNYIVHDIMDWIDLMLSPPLIRVKVKWSTFNQPPPPLSTTTVINNLSTSKPASKSWHPSYKGIPPTKRLGQTNASLMNAGISVTECLKFHSSAGPFLSPVPPNVVGYYDIIKDPMDLSCIERKLKNGHYATLTALFEDVEKIFLNCYLFNSETSEIYKQSKTLETYFREQVQPYAEKMIPPPRPIEMTEAEWHKMRKVLRKIRERSSAIPFSKPVKNVPRYYDHITHPIDLGTIRKKVDNKEYPTLGSFESDMKLMFSNCFSFNNPGDETYRMGRELYDIFLKEWNAEFPVSLKLKPVLDTTHHGEQDTHLTELGITAVNGKLQPFGEELINIEDEGIPSHSSASSLFKSASSATSTSHFRVEKNQPEMDLDKDPASTRINLLRRTSLQSTDNFMDSVVISVPQKESQPVIYQSTPRKRSFANDSKGGSKSGVTPKKIRFQGLGEKAKSPTLTLSRSVGNGEGFLDTNDLNDKLKRFTIVHQLLIIHPESFDFRIPVDPIALNVPTYLQIIKNPMDLQTIGTRLAHYASHMDFFLDVILMLKNAITFNQKDSPVYISAHLFYKYVQSLWRKHFQMTEFPTLLPHPIEKRSVKKQTSASSSSSTSNASSSKPSSAPTVTISFSKLTMTAGTSVPPSNSTFKEATAPECNSNSENTSPKEDFNSSLSSRSNSKSSLKISLPSLVPETSLSVDTSSISTQKEQKKNPSSPTSPSTPTTPSLITQNTQNTSSVTSLAPSSPSHSHPQPLFSPELFSLEMTPERLAVCNQAFQKAFTSKYAAPFLRPVDPELDGVPQYFDIIQTPMDFGTIHGRLSTSSYTTVGAFIEDVLLVFKNCSDFNGVEHPYTKQCKLLRHPLAYELRTVLPLLNVAMDMSKASRLLEKLKEHKAAYPFLVPVDAVLLQIPNYYEVIDYPIDFQTITKKLTEGQYTHFYQFFNDVRFIFYNCYKFNPQGHFVYKEGKELQKYFENECRKFKLASFLKLPHPLV